MFVQVIQGRTSDPAAMRAQSERWGAELGPDADGWLGSTAGVTDEGRSIAVVRFESEEAASRNSSRPEQGVWWEQMAATYDGEPTFQNHTLVDVHTYGDPDRAGFVQVMQGRLSDVHRGLALMASDPTDWASIRPDILGTSWSGGEDGSWTMAIYFTSEAAAREGEQKEEPPEVSALMQELGSLMIGEPAYLDLREPWLMSPQKVS
jgi:hypothetical protein